MDLSLCDSLISSKMPIRKVTQSQKKQVAGRQRYKCAANVPDYECPLGGKSFDESGYHIDHIHELRDEGSNDLENLQALCLMCHSVKTNRRSSQPKKVVKPKAPKAPKVHLETKPLRRFYSIDMSGVRREFDDLDSLIKIVDKLSKNDYPSGWGLLGLGPSYRVHVPVGDRIIERIEMLPNLRDPAVRVGYNLGLDV
jgi:5-methylcytosine-specific restriction endonuclease McrA